MAQPAKPGSKAYRVKLRDRLTILGFTEETIPTRVAEDLMVECRLRPRAAWRSAMEYSLDHAARRYNALSNDPRSGMRGSRIWEYEQWPDRGVRPTLPVLRILAEVYGTDWRSLLDLRDLEHLPPKDLAEYHAGRAPAAPPVGAGVVSRLNARDRVLPAAEKTDDNPLAEALDLTRTDVDDVQLSDLWSDVNHLSSIYPHDSPTSVLRQLSLVRRQATTLMKERHRPEQSRSLYLLGSKCHSMMAWMTADLGRYRSAQKLNSAAWLYSQHANDELARRWVRTAQSRVEFWAGNGVESAQLAADAMAYKVGDQMSDAPVVLAEARGWASVQAERQVLEAIGRWMRIEDAGPESPARDRFFDISPDRRHYMAGSSLLSVNRPGLALRELQNARQIFENMTPGHRWVAMEPMIRIDLSRAYLRLGDIEGTAAELRPFLASPVSDQPDMVRSTTKLLTAELAGPSGRGSTIARDLIDALTNV